MRFFGRSTVAERPLDPPFAEKNAFETGLAREKLLWEISTPGLTTQYKSFYFTFNDGKAGMVQFSYGNLGALVKVSPLAFTFYSEGHEAVVASQTFRASQMKFSRDNRSVTLGNHALLMDEDQGGWRVVIDDALIRYDLHLRIESEAFMVHDFGRATPQEQYKHICIPQLHVSGKVTAHGETSEVEGSAIYMEAYIMHVKFTDSCNEFTHFQFRSADDREVLIMMQYLPRAATATGARITFGSYVREGKVVALTFENATETTGSTEHGESGYPLPTTCEYTWSGKTLANEPFSAVCRMEFARASSITDVLSIFPKFFKDIVSIWAGLPYVFCFRHPHTGVTIESGPGGKRELTGMSMLELTKVHRTEA